MDTAQTRPLALVTGASSGIGYELARIAAENGHDLILAADRSLDSVSECLKAFGGSVETIEGDLATTEGVDGLLETVRGRPIDALFANAGQGLGGAFLDQDFADVRHVVDTNITGTIYLIHRVARQMRDANRGRILVTGSIAGYIPGSFQLVYNGTKAFIDSFTWGLREEMKDTGVSVTLLMPGATDTEFFVRAHMEDTKVGRMKKDDPAAVAQVGYDAMMKGQTDVVYGLKNKIQSSIANVTPASVLAAQHRKQAEPGSGRQSEGMSSVSMGAFALGGAAVAMMALAMLAGGRSNGNGEMERAPYVPRQREGDGAPDRYVHH